ncbi:MAG: CBS domain-containing protein [Proteobacteria bacterium]|nr:CBS domain-containing protein [Pseudomonadota bacterium]
MEKITQTITSKHSIPSDYKVKDLYTNFMNGKIKDSIAVIDKDNNPLGLIVKQKFLMKLSERYAYDLYYKKDVSSLMADNPLIVTTEDDINSVIDRALTRPSDNVYDEIIVVDENKKFIGLISVKELIIQ